MFGIKARWDGIEIDPCLPPEMLPAKVTRVFRGTTYRITITENKKMFVPCSDKEKDVEIVL